MHDKQGTGQSKMIFIEHQRPLMLAIRILDAVAAAADYLVPTIEAIEQELAALGANVTEGVAAKVFEKEFS